MKRMSLLVSPRAVSTKPYPSTTPSNPSTGHVRPCGERLRSVLLIHTRAGGLMQNTHERRVCVLTVHLVQGRVELVGVVSGRRKVERHPDERRKARGPLAWQSRLGSLTQSRCTRLMMSSSVPRDCAPCHVAAGTFTIHDAAVGCLRSSFTWNSTILPWKA